MILPHRDDDLYNRRLAKAATSLVIRHPFFGYILFGSSVRVKCGEDVDTMATNGVDLFCGRDFVKTEPLEFLEFVLLHELLHIYFNHFGRRGTRDPLLWNVAVDIYVNDQCAQLFTTDPLMPYHVDPRLIQPAMWAREKTCEEIYDILAKVQEEEPEKIEKMMPSEDLEIGNGKDMLPPPESVPGQEPDPNDPQSSKEWQAGFHQDVAQAKAMAERTPTARKLTSAIQERMTKIMKATLPWGSILRGDLAYDLGWDESTYAPPKVKYYPIILPQTRSVKERVLLLAVDISASVTQELIKIFISNVMAAAMKATKTVVVTFDQVQRDYHETTNPKNIFKHVKFVSGDHYMTSAKCVFEHADRLKPSAICVLTDGHIELPDHPYKNTTFVIPDGGRRLPWGRHIVMEFPW